MKHTAFLVTLCLFAVGFWVLFAWHSCEDPVHADEPDSKITALWLGRLCINEAGWNPYDCMAIAQTLRNINRDLVEAMRRHSGRLFRPDQRWTTRVPRDCSEPPGWRRDRPWLRWRSSCRRIMRLAGHLSTNAVRACAGTPVTWGGRVGDSRGADDPYDPRFYRPVECEGDTYNVFLERRQ